MANSNQVPNLKGIHRKMHDIAEQIRVMNELNARLVQHLTQTPALTTVPILKGLNRSHRSHRYGDQDTFRNHQNASHVRFMQSPHRQSPNLHTRYGRRGRNL